MPTKTFKSIAKKSGKTVTDMHRYWGRAEKSYDRAQARAKQGKREPVRDKHSYVMATTLRQAQRTGANPHKPMGGKRKKKKGSKKEAFELRIDQILEDAAYGMTTLVEELSREYAISEGKMWNIAKKILKLVKSGGKAALSVLAAAGIGGIRPLIKLVFLAAKGLVKITGEGIMGTIDYIVNALDQDMQKAVESLLKAAKGNAKEGWQELKAQAGVQEEPQPQPEPQPEPEPEPEPEQSQLAQSI